MLKKVPIIPKYDQKKFCKAFFDDDSTVESFFANSRKFDYPLFEVVVKKFYDEKPLTPLKLVNDALRECGLNGCLLTEADLLDSPFKDEGILFVKFIFYKIKVIIST